MDSCRRAPPIRLPPYANSIVSPLDWRQWQASLSRHPDKAFADFVVGGIRDGFRVGYVGTPADCKKAPKNMRSAKEQRAVINAYLADECAEGRILGPFEEQVLPQLHVSRLGVVPKHTPGSWRLIVDLSSPEGLSVNDGISRERCSLSYVSVRSAAEAVARLGRGALLAKIDIKAAYRMLPVHPDDRWLLGMQWEGALFVETALPFGLRSAPKLFTAVADALEWIVEQEGVHPIMHYLDDFLLLGPPGQAVCAHNLEVLLSAFSRLGVPVAWEKLVGPTTRLTFLGIELDTVAMLMRLPERKLAELRELLVQWRGKHSCHKKELESLVGKLQHAATVVQPGKSFLRRLFELLAGTEKVHHHISLRGGARSDITWWDTFLELWNGVSIIPPLAKNLPTHHVFTDAAGKFGCGAVWDRLWLHHGWQSNLQLRAIATLELLPIILAAMVWGRRWSGSLVVVHCDNQAVVTIVNSGYSKDKDIMHMIRCLFFIRAHWDFQLLAEHIPGENNKAADAISRNNFPLFFQVSPDAAPQATPIPQALLSWLVEQQPDWTSTTWVKLFRNCLMQV